LIDSHSAPKGLTVVSSDRRVRQAARRSRARALTSDEFLDRIDRSRFKRPSGTPGAGTRSPEAEGRSGPTSQDESLYWIEQFRDLEAMPEIREVAAADAALITDAEIERIRREIEREP